MNGKRYLSAQQYDVVVVGAGSAGVAAATSAARCGAQVAIIDSRAFSGGLATAAYVGTVCGLFTSGTGLSDCVGSFPNEFRSRLYELENRDPIEFDKGLFFVPYQPWAFEAVCDALLESARVQRFFHTTCFDVVVEDERLAAIDCLVGNVRSRIVAKSFIDASGEGILSQHVARISQENYQAPGYVFGVGNLSSEVCDLSEPQLSKSVLSTLIAQEHEGELEKGASRFTVVPGSLFNSQVALKFAYPKCRTGEFNELSSLESFGRKSIQRAFAALKRNNQFFSNSSLSFIASQIGIRSGPRGEGKQVLCAQEVISCNRSPRVVARGVWPLEYWGAMRKAELTYLDSEFYDIPAEVLCSSAYSNLYFCGRGISADEDALSSARVIGTCLSTGQAAGVLAATKAEGSGVDDAIAKIQRTECFSAVGIGK